MPSYSHTESIQLIAAIKRLLNVQSNLQSSLLRVTVKRQSDSKMHIDIVFGWSFVALFSFRLFANNQITPFYSILSSQKVGTFDVSSAFLARACFAGIGALMWTSLSHTSRTILKPLQIVVNFGHMTVTYDVIVHSTFRIIMQTIWMLLKLDKWPS